MLLPLPGSPWVPVTPAQLSWAVLQGFIDGVEVANPNGSIHHPSQVLWGWLPPVLLGESMAGSVVVTTNHLCALNQRISI